MRDKTYISRQNIDFSLLNRRVFVNKICIFVELRVLFMSFLKEIKEMLATWQATAMLDLSTLLAMGSATF